MFSKKRETEFTASTSFQAIETIVGESALFEGAITTKAARRNDGKISAASNRAAPPSSAGEGTGSVVANDLFIAGAINGNAGKTEFVPGGFLCGELAAGDPVVEQGACLEGSGNIKAQK